MKALILAVNLGKSNTEKIHFKPKSIYFDSGVISKFVDMNFTIIVRNNKNVAIAG